MPQGFSREDVAEGKMYAVLGYLSILCILPLILKKHNPFVLGHGRQGLVLFMGEVGALIVSIVFPWFLAPATFVLSVLSFFGMVAALQGRMTDLPVVASIARKIIL